MITPLVIKSIIGVGSLIFLCAAALLGVRTCKAGRANVYSSPLTTLKKTPAPGPSRNILPLHSPTPESRSVHPATPGRRATRTPPLFGNPAPTLGGGATRVGSLSPPDLEALRESPTPSPPPAYTER